MIFLPVTCGFLVIFVTLLNDFFAISRKVYEKKISDLPFAMTSVALKSNYNEVLRCEEELNLENLKYHEGQIFVVSTRFLIRDVIPHEIYILKLCSKGSNRAQNLSNFKLIPWEA